ncbi:MAG TPA: response regulator [Candidatus Angelobacter sp.]|nr:response regulator [Candidatus Angelobacter sp.]
MKTRILVVDDDKSIADSLCTILKSAGYQAISRYSGEDALAAFNVFQPDVVIADVVMPGMSGIELCTQLRDRCHTSMVLLSGNVMTEELLNEGRTKLRDDIVVLAKPYPPRDLIRLIQEITSAGLKNVS